LLQRGTRELPAQRRGMLAAVKACLDGADGCAPIKAPDKQPSNAEVACAARQCRGGLRALRQLAANRQL